VSACRPTDRALDGLGQVKEMGRRGDPSCTHKMDEPWRWRACGLGYPRLILSVMLVPLLGCVLLCHASLEASQEQGSSDTGASVRLSRELTSQFLHSSKERHSRGLIASVLVASHAHAEHRLLQRGSTWARQIAAPYIRSAGERVLSLPTASTQATSLGLRRGTRELSSSGARLASTW